MLCVWEIYNIHIKKNETTVIETDFTYQAHK